MGFLNWFKRKEETRSNESDRKSAKPLKIPTGISDVTPATANPPEVYRNSEEEKARYAIQVVQGKRRIRRSFSSGSRRSKNREGRVASSREKLIEKGLPQLMTASDLASEIGLSMQRLHWLATKHRRTASPHYVTFLIPKKSGGERTISRPRPQLEACQRWILSHILSRLTVSDAAHGYVSGRSTATNAKPHLKKRYVLQVDLKDFFPSVSMRRVARFFASLGYGDEVSRLLASLCTEPLRLPETVGDVTYWIAISYPGLPQGACTSPALSNLIAASLDRRIVGLANKLGWSYTRYADDLTLSASESQVSPGYLLHRIRAIVQDEGFRMNPEKTRMQRSHSRQQVTGLIVNDNLSIPRETIRRLRSILHHAKTEGLQSQNREKHPRFTEWVTGMISYVSMVHPEKGKMLRQQFDAIRNSEASLSNAKATPNDH